MQPVHRPDPENGDACVCGGQVVYFEPPLLDRDGDPAWRSGVGCEELGRPSNPFLDQEMRRAFRGA